MICVSRRLKRIEAISWAAVEHVPDTAFNNGFLSFRCFYLVNYHKKLFNMAPRCTMCCFINQVFLRKIDFFENFSDDFYRSFLAKFTKRAVIRLPSLVDELGDKCGFLFQPRIWSQIYRVIYLARTTLQQSLEYLFQWHNEAGFYFHYLQ